MPKQVDHEARRQRIADAVCRLAARDGIEGVSLRHVAAEAGISMGQVQHYFTTKDEMLLSAFHTMSARVEQRLATATQALGEAPSARDMLRTLLIAMMPVDEESRFEAPLWVAFMARAVVAPELAELLRSPELIDFVADLLRAAQEAGEVSGSVDARFETISLFAAADGLMVRILLGAEEIGTAVATIDYHLDRLFAVG